MRVLVKKYAWYRLLQLVFLFSRDWMGRVKLFPSLLYPLCLIFFFFFFAPLYAININPDKLQITGRCSLPFHHYSGTRYFFSKLIINCKMCFPCGEHAISTGKKGKRFLISWNLLRKNNLPKGEFLYLSAINYNVQLYFFTPIYFKPRPLYNTRLLYNTPTLTNSRRIPI